mmetsp:Transcript_14447/g.41034  ORF Transcript_14447/g.41034 Transcript_14447/m.41034 type:complete len:108 (-) Transcript_14447:18-341(-)
MRGAIAAARSMRMQHANQANEAAALLRCSAHPTIMAFLYIHKHRHNRAQFTFNTYTRTLYIHIYISASDTGAQSSNRATTQPTNVYQRKGSQLSMRSNAMAVAVNKQ